MVSHPKKPIKNRELIVGPKIISLILVSVIALGLIFNLTLAIKKILTPPKIVLESPQNGELKKDPVVEVRGTTEKNVELFLNGGAINLTKDGKFRELVSLQPGLNEIRLTGKKRYSAVRNLAVRVVYEPNKNLTMNKK